MIVTAYHFHIQKMGGPVDRGFIEIAREIYYTKQFLWLLVALKFIETKPNNGDIEYLYNH